MSIIKQITVTTKSEEELEVLKTILSDSASSTIRSAIQFCYANLDEFKRFINKEELKYDREHLYFKKS